MLLKKQTVWLLTMLSLVVVLSVYYLTSPDNTGKDTASTEQQQKNNGQNDDTPTGAESKMDDSDTKSDVKSDSKSDGTTEEKSDAKTEENSDASVAISSGDDEFEALRLKIDDERSKLSSELTEKMGNTELSAEERNEAYAAAEQLSEAKVEENILEDMIVAMDYDAALVRMDGKNIKVTVKAKEQSAASANKIIRLVRGEVEDANDITVDFQIKK